MRLSPMVPPRQLPEAKTTSLIKENRRNMYVWLLLALLINFACIFAAMGLGLNFGDIQSLEASVLAQSTADYGVISTLNLRRWTQLSRPKRWKI